MAIDRPLAYHVPLALTATELAQAVGSMRGPALLEGGASFGSAGRWSFFTAEPTCRLWSDDSRFHVQYEPEGSRQPNLQIAHGGDPLAVFDDQLARLGLDPHAEAPGIPGSPPFQGGLVGFFSYDLAPAIERLPRKAAPDSRLPHLGFGLYNTVAWVDHLTGAAGLSVHDLSGEASLADLQHKAQNWARRLGQPQPALKRSRLHTSLSSNFSRDAYLDAVERSLEYIRAGDIFQVNLSQRFEATGEIVPLDLYLRLRRHSPAPFAAYLDWQGASFVSASPELFYETRGTRIVTRPIKGTRPRGRTPAEDQERMTELQNSAKDRAELVMIVDLERNDLGRVCRYGSVKVAEPQRVESFAQVHHLVATVEGQLREKCTPGDVVRAAFPGGSITGAPKIRAMQIIDELEPSRRSLYTGAIGYYSRGASAFNIAIRTLLIEGSRVSYQVGGGIVADSLAPAEYEETLHKGRGLREVIEGNDAS